MGFHASGCWCAGVAEVPVLSVKVALEETWQQTGQRLGMWLPDRGVLQSEAKVSVKSLDKDVFAVSEKQPKVLIEVER